MHPANPEEIDKIIKSLKVNKAIGPNSISPAILRNFKKELSELLCLIVNLSFSEGIFPDPLKRAKVIPIYKKEDPLNCNNFKLISLLSNISEVFEKLMYRRLYYFLEQHDCLYTQQFGFRNSHSTNQALIDIAEKIRKALDNGNFACGVFLDLQKAFDTVNHEILVSKLDYYGVRGTPLDLFKNYLKNRTQFTSINNPTSETLHVKSGVPQGSILGPLLFLINVKDMYLVTEHADMYHFGDNTSLLYRHKSIKKMNQIINFEIKRIAHWLIVNKISLNSTKTETIIFKFKKKKISKKFNFRVSGQTIIPIIHSKYLGVILDESLSFYAYLNILKYKLNRANGISETLTLCNE